jgi:23S rRNA G2445 N2-methylase RlmL
MLARELSSNNIGALQIEPKSGGVAFSGSHTTAMRAVMWSRLALRVMERLSHADAGIRTPGQLYDFARRSCIWDSLMRTSSTLKVSTLLSRPSPGLSHSHFCALTVKNAVTDHFVETSGQRPSVSVDEPEVPLFLSIHEESASLYRVWSGVASLHKRGYRSDGPIHKAALRESTAAGLLMIAGYTNVNATQRENSINLCDPMCGSGTLAIEAALMACNTAPGLVRKQTRPTHSEAVKSDKTTLPFLSWCDVSAGSWDSVVQDAESKDRRRLHGSPFLFCNDLNENSIALAKRGAKLAQVDHLISFSNRNIRDYTIPQATKFVIVNPPWGERLDGDSFESAWSALGDWAKKSAISSEMNTNSISDVNESSTQDQNTSKEDENDTAETHPPRAFDLWVISGNPSATRLLRLRASDRHTVESGGAKLKFLKYEIY